MFWVFLLTAIAEVESGCKIHAVGKVGEVSQYQISPIALKQYNKMTGETLELKDIKKDDTLAFAVAKTLLSKWGDMYYYKYKKQPTVFVYAILWRQSGNWDHDQSFDQDRALRVSNLFYVNKFSINQESKDND